MPEPLYTAENIRIAFALRWSLSWFWNSPAPNSDRWLNDLQAATEPDGVRILDHKLLHDNTSQFLLSTKATVSPAECIRSVKGRLQYLVRKQSPKAFRRNYSISSVGEANRSVIEEYVQSQIQHHQAADHRVASILEPYQFRDRQVRLELPHRSSHGDFICNLHFVAVHEERFAQVNDDFLAKTSAMLRRVAAKKQDLLSQVGLLVDHVHWTIGCGIAEAPLEIGLAYLNNLAFAHGMRKIYQYGFYVGTFGPYDLGTIRRSL